MVLRGEPGRGTMGLVLALSFSSLACGSGSSTPTAPTVAATPVPAPTPTPTPRQTISLDAPADHYQFSNPIARLTSPQAFDLTFTPRGVHDPYPSDFSHTVEVWLWHPAATSETFASAGVAFTMAWEGNNRWRVDSYTPESRWYYTSSRFDLPLGQTQSIRVTKHAAGIAEFFVNGVSMHSIDDKEPTRMVRVRVVGTASDFSYVPVGLTSLGLFNEPGPPHPCVGCIPHR